MIVCRTCRTPHINLKLARGQTQKCGAPKHDGSNCSQTLTHRDSVADTRKYDKMNFIGAKKSVQPKVHVIHVNRSKSAPIECTWPFKGMSPSVTYVRSIARDATWASPANTDIRLPFNALNPMISGMQGLILSCPALAGTTSARAHFDAITLAMTTPKKGQDVTEAVGEAAAAIKVMANHPGYELLWGFDVHAGAGIDQIWWNQDAKNPHFLVVEAKGPTASLSSGALGNPPGYEQMEKLWVIDRLGRMRSGVGQALADKILDHLALDVHVAITGHGGSSKNYYGCQARPKKIATGTLSGMTVTAKWNGDATLDGTVQTHKYTFP
jgi:hypothetical protein